ncbi:mitosis inhibitor protein kinase swe1 [Mycoemilia scoparia]|uniref:Mitosis inhibitor protein kinase swe1 n=1 Tax=Mycoemilia scoparia TaxID=417184 RepID=A0A9W8DW41_9FUNG|nr:mitosis inhibitor protein kinase swe1 [Mycoemilia scoparia]
MVNTPHRTSNKCSLRKGGAPMFSTPTTTTTSRLRRRTLPTSLQTLTPSNRSKTNQTTGQETAFGRESVSTVRKPGTLSMMQQLSFPPSSVKVSANLFTPPATKLVRPDPSAFASTGLISKKNKPLRPPASATFSIPDTPCKKTPLFATTASEGAVSLPHSFQQNGAFNFSDPFRLGKHRSPSLESLKITKKVHVGPETDLLSTPLSSVRQRGRNNTLVEEYPETTGGLELPDFKSKLYSQPPPGFRLPGHNEDDSPISYTKRGSFAPPPAFPLGKLQGLDSTAKRPDDIFESSIEESLRTGINAPKPSADGTVDNDDAQSETGSSFSSSSTLHHRNDNTGRRDEDDTFMFCDNYSHEEADSMQMATSPVLSESPKILPTERPQMPQIINGYATNYPHFLRPEYFSKGLSDSHGSSYFSPPEQASIEGLGYLDHLEQQFDIVERIGAGSFSFVYHARDMETGNVFAVKKTKAPFEGRKDRLAKLEEVRIMWSLAESPYCVRLVDAWEQYGHLYLQTELCERGTLEEFLDEEANNDSNLEERAWQVLSSIGKGLSHMHSMDIIHLDIKPSNILVGNDGLLKIGDFGHASKLPVKQGKDLEGDREYLAPELLRGSCGKASDVFSLGLVLLEIVANVVLPDNGPEWQRLRQGDFTDANWDSLQISSELRSIITSMLNPDPAQRPTIDAVLSNSSCQVATKTISPTV